MPTNLYGPGDNYHPEHSHVPAALIRRFYEAKLANAPSVTVWGTGKPRREFMSVDDLADACVFALKHYSADEFINTGTGQDVTIGEFAALVADVVGYRGKLEFDTLRPDGAPQKLLDVSKLTELGWTCRISRFVTNWLLPIRTFWRPAVRGDFNTGRFIASAVLKSQRQRAGDSNPS